MAEQFGFDDLRGHAFAFDHQEPTGAARRLVNHPSGHLLARARLARDQDRRIGGRDGAGIAERVDQRRVPADRRRHASAHGKDGRGDQFALRGQGNVIQSAGADRPDCKFGGRMNPAGEHRHRDPFGMQPLQEARHIHGDIDHHQIAPRLAKQVECRAGLRE